MEYIFFATETANFSKLLEIPNSLRNFLSAPQLPAKKTLHEILQCVSPALEKKSRSAQSTDEPRKTEFVLPRHSMTFDAGSHGLNCFKNGNTTGLNKNAIFLSLSCSQTLAK